MAKKKFKAPVVWTPQPKQEQALVRKEFEVLYGGARGGGKTDAGIAWLLYPVWDWLRAIRDKDTEKAARLARYRALIVRKNADDLKDWLDRAESLYAKIFGTAVQFVGKPVEIKFGNGPVFRTGHLKDGDAYRKYQGHEYQRVLVEELTQIPSEENYEDLISSCRSTISEIDAQVFATTNPDGPGFYWVKDRFHVPEWPPENPIPSQQEVILPNGDKKFVTRVFISALLRDNPKLQEKDEGYEVRIASMKDESRKKAWLQGYWGEPIIDGVIFNDEVKFLRQNGLGEFSFDPKYPVYTYWDIGRDATPILFMQLVGNTWHLIDYYENSQQGFGHYADVLREKEKTLHYWYGQHFGPHDLEKTDMANETIWQLAEKNGIVFTIIPRAATADGIEAAKAKFPRLKMDMAAATKKQPTNHSLLQSLSAFRREWDDDKQVYKDTYIHDWASHAGTAMFYWGLQRDPVYNPTEGDFSLYKTTFN
jgi:hypothetical protein